MPDGGVAGQAPERGLVEDGAHQAEVALHRHVAAVAHGDPRALLAAVLQGVERVEREPRHVAPRGHDAEDPALLLGAVVEHAGHLGGTARRLAHDSASGSPPS